MSDAEILKRIDRSLERIDAHMERGNELMAEVREEMRLTREEMRLTREEVRRSRETHDDLRQFIREQTLRMQKASERQERALDRLAASWEASTEAIVGRLEEMGDEIRSNTRAVLSVLDRLEGNGGSAPA